MELIASGHGDNDFFMDPVRVKWPGHFVCFFFLLFLKGVNVRVNITLNRAFTEYVNAFGFMTGSTCQQRFQMTHFVFTQCKFANASLDLID